MNDLRPLPAVQEMRQSFGSTFASPAHRIDVDVEQLLAIHCAGQGLALRVSELARLERRRELVPLPVPHPHLLGLAGIQGHLVPVYSLASLLDIGKENADWRWIAVSSGGDALGLAFGSLDAYFSVAKTDVLDTCSEQPARRQVRSAVRFDGTVRNVISLASVQANIREAAFASNSGA